MKNKIFIPFDDKYFFGYGGPATFIRNLKNYIDSKGYLYLNDYKYAKVILFPAIFDKTILKYIKSKKGKIIQRLDGIYYPSKHGDQYKDLNNNIKDIYQNYSDFVIFQSNYSLKQCFKNYGLKREDEYEIIINGANKSIFYPDKKIINKQDTKIFKFVTTGHFRNIDMLEPIIKALDYLKNKINFELYIIGPIANEKLKMFLKRDYIVYYEYKKPDELAEILRNYSVFLYSHLNPPCPNSVIEAISCGMPVVSFKSGAMSELCFFSKDLLAEVSNEVFQKYEDFDYKKRAEKIIFVVENYDYYKKLSIENSNLYSFEECGEKYIKILNNQLDNVNREFKVINKINNKINKFKSMIRNNPKAIKMKNTDEYFSLIKDDLVKLSNDQLIAFLYSLIDEKCNSLSSFDSLNLLFNFEKKIYELEGRESVRYGDGVHTKHRHIKYHDFFIDNIPEGSRILDIGCGNGSLTYDIAINVKGAFILGIDKNKEYIEFAKKTFSKNNIEYFYGDALIDLPDDKFDIIVLSNVLEHLEQRIEFLKGIRKKYKPNKFLIRVPIFERDWRVPLKEELGFDYRLDQTHFIEYKIADFVKEINDSGLRIKNYKVNWGEIWAEII